MKGSTQYPDELGDKNGLSKCVQCQFRKLSTVQHKFLMLICLFIGLAYNTSVTICARGGRNHFIYCASCTLGTSPGRLIDHRHKESTYKAMLHRRVQLPVAKMNCFTCRRGKSNSTVSIPIFMSGNSAYFSIDYPKAYSKVSTAANSNTLVSAGYASRGQPRVVVPTNLPPACIQCSR